MTGNTLTRTLNAFAHMARRPRDLPRWLNSAVTRRSPIDAAVPWTSWRAIDYLRKSTAARDGARVFEWGGGGSTRFFLRRGCDVTTVESSAAWQKEIEKAAAADGRAASLHVRHVPAETADPAAVKAYVQAVHDGQPWDVVLVDGLEETYVSRIDCIRELQPGGVVKPGGMMILDDSWRPEYANVPDMLPGWTRHALRSLGPARLGVTQTDIYIAPTP